MEKSVRLIDRHLSWLSFNHRVLQEAGDPNLPLLERLRFLAIFSSNLDEFFAVRVAALHAGDHANKTLEAIRIEVERQQKQFGKYYLEQILPGLRAHGIGFASDTELDEEQAAAVREYWDLTLRTRLEPAYIPEDGPAPFLHNRQIYLAVVLEGKPAYAIVEIPTPFAPRFVEVPAHNGQRCFVFLDDIIRVCLPELFPRRRIIGAYSIKLSRDAELHIDDEFSGDLLEKIRDGVKKRKQGMPSRLLYDPQMPAPCVDLLRSRLGLHSESLIPGWRYHNFSDFIQFAIPGVAGLEHEPIPPLRDNALDASPSLFDAIERQDRFLCYPYHSYDYVIRFIEEAAYDAGVTSIDITLYRAARNSRVVRALLEAARNGKAVTAFIEMKARFDEEPNFFWADELENAGARVVYSLPGLKVHCKVCMVTRSVNGAETLYAYLSTGNFNENTARVYSDYGLFTAEPRITQELGRVFDFLAEGRFPTSFEHLLVAPFNMRQRFTAMLDKEIQNAQAGKQAYIILKLNNLEDPIIIRKLCEAYDAGVAVRLIVRSICCLPKRGTRSMEAISIVDRFLEHGRIYIFHNGGDEQYFLGSADWMTRNLSRRIEVVFPVFDETIRSDIRTIADMQLRDNVKARILDNKLSNRFHRSDDPPFRSQMAIYRFLRDKTGVLSVAANSVKFAG